MNAFKKRTPSGVWLFVIERGLSGAALLYVVFGGLNVVQGKWALWLSLVGILFMVTAGGVWRRKWWGWLLAVMETVAGIGGGIVGVTYAALSFPAAWGRGWLAAFIVVALVSFAALITLLVSLAQAQSFFKDSEQHWRVEKWNRMLCVSVLSLIIIRLFVGGAVIKNIEMLRGAGGSTKSAWEHAVGYCDGLEEVTQKDSCYLQIAVAAEEAGDDLPADFCARVSLAQPQLKFLCVAFSRQIESCDAFTAARERALCRGLVSGNAQECNVLGDDERKVCETTVRGYLESAREEQK